MKTLNLSEKELGFLFNVLDKIQLQGLEAKEMRVGIMKKVVAELEEEQKPTKDA